MKTTIRKNSLTEELYIQKDGSWGPHKTAKRFASDDAAERYAAKTGLEVYGLFN